MIDGPTVEGQSASPAICTVFKRLQQLEGGLSNLAATSNALAERVCGSVPTSPAQPTGNNTTAPNRPDCLVERLHTSLDQIEPLCAHIGADLDRLLTQI